MLSEQTGLEIGDEAGLMPCILELARAKRQPGVREGAFRASEQVEATGYGIVMPTIDELSRWNSLEDRPAGRAVRRPAGSQRPLHPDDESHHPYRDQPHRGHREAERRFSPEPALQDFESDPVKLWESNIFGKSLHELVNDGLQNKLLHMPQEARTKMQETLEQVINEGCTGLICILL